QAAENPAIAFRHDSRAITFSSGARSWTSRSGGSSIFGRLQRLASAKENSPAWTKLENFASAAVGLARIAAAAPVPDEPVAPVCPMLARDELHQVELNLHRILLFR